MLLFSTRQKSTTNTLIIVGQPIQILILLTTVRIISGTASNLYAVVLQMTARFATAVSNGPAANIMATIGVNATCP
jgi:hypothetical protein